MNRRQKIIISVTGIFLVLLILVGLTYAYFLTQIQGNENNTSISVTTANLIVEYGDGNNTLEPENAIVPDTVVGTKTFTVTNKGNDTSNYVVVIEDVVVTNATTNASTTFETNDFVYTLTCNKYNRTEYEANPNTAVSTGTCTGISTETEFPMTGGLVVRDKINVGEVYLYGLTLTYKDNGNDQSNDMNKTLSAKVNIKNEESYVTLANTVKTTFKKGTSINLTTSEAIEDADIKTKAMNFPFTVENTGETHQNITIKLTDIEMDNTLKDSDFRWGLFNPVTGNALSRGVFSDVETNEIMLYTETIIDAGEEARDYELKIWLYDDKTSQESLIGKNFKANLSITGETVEYTPEECFIFDSKTGTITSYSNNDTCPMDIVVPKTINGISVTSYNIDWDPKTMLPFYFENIILPNTIKSVGGPLYDDSETLTMPEGVTNFERVYNISNEFVLFLSDTIESIPSDLQKKSSLVVPFGVATINLGGDLGKFNNNVILHNNLTTIEHLAFTNEITSIEIPESVTTIKKYAFSIDYQFRNALTVVLLGKTEIPEGFEKDWNCIKRTSLGNGNFECYEYATVTFRP